MSEAFITRRGGGGLSKCSIIVHIDSGSTVGAYSDSAATTLVKMGKEIGTSGDYVITGLNTGTYYVKASKGTNSIISTALTFQSYGANYVELSYVVPSAYQRVEYIQSTGTQYFTLNLLPQVGKFEVDYIIDAITGYVFGAEATSSEVSLFFGTSAMFGRYASNTSGDNMILEMKQNTQRRTTSVWNYTGTSNISDTFNGGTAVSNRGTSFNQSLSISVFGKNSSASAKIKLFGFKFYNPNGDLLVDLIPCYRKSDNAAGAWDTVNKVFYSNMGTGTFVVGGDVN